MKRFLIHITLLLMLVISYARLSAQTAESYDSKIDGASFRVDSTCRTIDSIFNTLDYSTQITSTYLVRNSVILELLDNPAVVYPDSFSIDVNVKIEWTDSNNIINTDHKTLRVEYNNRHLIQDTLRSYYGFMGGHIVVVTITGITAHNISTPLPDIIRLVNRMELYRDYLALCGQTTVLNVDTAYLPDQDELLVSWEELISYANSHGPPFYLYSTADEYDLEWTFYDDSSEVAKKFYATNSIPYGENIFHNHCGRVTVQTNSYQIPLIYEKGILIYRVRAVRTIQNGIRIPGEWTNIGSGHVLYKVEGHEKRLNWQSKTSFAEGGKRKSVVNYFDGSSHSRQIVTKINTDSTAIVAETIYDWEGRPVVNTLPAPTIDKLIKHFAIFNRDAQDSAYTWRDLDSLTDGCNNPPKVMSTSSGSSKYYSPSNPYVNSGFHQYIPDAFGYPFSQTAYTSDLTNRIRRSSGPGKDHKMGTEHVTTYYYGGAEQSELNRLFADEAGQASHYFKNLVVDPNGQVSVTYQDMHGRTIATALAGYPSPLDSVRLDTLPDFRNDTMLYDAILDTVNNLIDGTSITCTKTFTAASAGNFSFYYTLLPENFMLQSCDSANFCFDCVYDLKITVTDDCNNKKMPGAVPFVQVDSNYSFSGILPYYFDTLCNEVPIIDSFTLNLPVGEYTVTKTLSIKKEAIDYYYNYYLRKDTCLKTFDDFYNDALQEVDLEGCQVTCSSCLTRLGDSATFCSNYLGKLKTADSTRILYGTDTLNAYLAYQELKHACDVLCDSFDICEHKRAMMLADMSPGGQYAMYHMDSMSEMFSCADSTSIFYDTSGSIYHHLPLYSDSSIVYRKNNTEPDTVIADFNHDGIIDSLRPNSLTPVQFIQFWKPSWAEALLPYHPEYCYYQFCVANSGSNQYDEWLRSISEYDTAAYYGLMNPLNMPGDSCHQPANTDHQDPFFNSGGLGVGSNAEFKERLMRYACYDSIGAPGSTHYLRAKSIWDISSTLIDCSDPSCTNCMKNYYWNVFRNMYLGQKKIVEDSIMKVWGHDNCGANDPFVSGPRSTLSCFRSKEPRFEIVDNQSAPLALYSADTAAAMHKALSLSGDAESFSCRDYASYWWRQLRGCGIPDVDSARIINELIAVCDSGTDAGHPMGASSVRPNTQTPNGNKTFEEVLSWMSGPGWTYHPSDSCTSLLITNPLPNSASPMYYQTAQIDRPEPCVCHNIIAAKHQYLIDTSGSTSFSDFLYKKKNISISENDINILIQSCDSNNVCQRLPHPVTMPYQFGCNIVCANCYQIITAYNNFLHQFPGVYNSPNYYTLMQSSMNSELGMNLTVNEYFSFMADSCHYTEFPYTDTVPCHVPMASDDTVYIGYDQPANIAVTANDHPAGALLIEIIRHGIYGTDAVAGTNIYYGPFAGYDHDNIDTVIYTECNHCNNISCDTAMIFIHISSTKSHYSPPEAIADTITVCTDSVYAIDPVLNDTTSDGSTMHLSAAVLMAGSPVGTASVLGNYVVGTIHVPGAYNIAYSVCTDDPVPQCSTGFIHVIVHDCGAGARMAHGKALGKSAKAVGETLVIKQTGSIRSGDSDLSAPAAPVPALKQNRADFLVYLSHRANDPPTSAISYTMSKKKALHVELPQRLKGAAERKVIANKRKFAVGGRDLNSLISAAIRSRMDNKIQRNSQPVRKIENLPLSEIFRNIKSGTRTEKSSLWTTGERRKINTSMSEGDRPALFSPLIKAPAALSDGAVMTQAAPGGLIANNRPPLGGGVSLSGPTWCDTLEDINSDFIATGGLGYNGDILYFFNQEIGAVSHYDADSGRDIANTYEWIKEQMTGCGITCTAWENCDTLNAILTNFYALYPAAHDSVSPVVFNAFLNYHFSTLAHPINVPYEEWADAYACCSIILPVADTTMSHCDSLILIDYVLLTFQPLLAPDSCLPDYFWSYAINETWHEALTIEQLNSQLGMCSSFPVINYCQDTLRTHCDSVRNMTRILNAYVPFIEGGSVTLFISTTYYLQFGVVKDAAEVMHEIVACDTGLCVVDRWTKFYIDSIHDPEICWHASDFTAAMNGFSGYHYTAEVWCARLTACGANCQPFCTDTFSWCDSLTAAYNYYIAHYGADQMQNILPYFNGIWGDHHYEGAMSVDNTLAYWFDRMDSCGLSCHLLVDCDTLAWAIARFDSIYPGRRDSCTPGVLTNYLSSTFYPFGDGPDYADWVTLYSCCGIPLPRVDTVPTHCDTLVDMMLLLQAVNGGLTDSCLPDFAWDVFIINTFPDLGVTTLSGLQAVLGDCAHFPPLNVCDTAHSHCDSIGQVVDFYNFAINFDGGDGSADYHALAEVYQYVMGDSLGVTQVIHEIAACDSSSCIPTGYGQSYLAEIATHTSGCMREGDFVQLMYAATGLHRTAAQWCAALIACGDSCPSFCGDTSLSSCDSVNYAFAVYAIMESGNPPESFDLPVLSAAFSQYYGRPISEGEAVVMVLECNDTTFCTYAGESLQILTSVYASYQPCLPQEVAEGLWELVTGGTLPLHSDGICSILTHCGDTCFHLCPDSPMTSCDSIQMVITAWQHVIAAYPDIDQASLEALGQAILHNPNISYDTIVDRAGWCDTTISCKRLQSADSLYQILILYTPDYVALTNSLYISHLPDMTISQFDSLLALCDTSHVTPCAQKDTIKAQINIFLSSHPGVLYASNFYDLLNHYLDSVLRTYITPHMHPHPRPGDTIDWCGILAACGDSCPTPIPGPELCNRPLLPPVDAHYTDSCNIQMEDYAFANAAAAWSAYMSSLHDEFENKYISKCLGAYRLESFAYRHPNAEYHYTLYYYDQAGNLLKTIPPNGVDLYTQHHKMATRYRYNTLNQVVEQMTPDAGRTLMWYDLIGKVVLSQNARQKPLSQFSYTKYDPLQRITEVGKWDGFINQRYGIIDTFVTDSLWYDSYLSQNAHTEVTRTYYDYDTLHIYDTLGMPDNEYLRNRVASTTYADVLDTTNIHNYQSATHYRYDIHGNVNLLVQENTSLRRIGQQWKKMSYDYDLISGKVNEVIYQGGKPDMFIHQYEYDADNRLTDIRTTRDSVIWDHDASYSYYKHGPLARMEIGDAKVQAENYVYTIQGWMKGINGLDAQHNIAGDGAASGINHIVARSEMNYALNYFNNDYQPIAWGTSVSSNNNVETPVDNLNIRPLYNGNIAMMQLNLPKVGQAQAYRYRYDQLNRLTGMDAFSGLLYTAEVPSGNLISRWNNTTPMADYAERVNYDPNGNIAYYNRHGNSGTNIDMDSMIYRYLPGTNKLDHVDDAVAATNYSVDIDDQDTLNYRYDQIGNMVRDTSEGIDTILWNVYGKIQEIDKHNRDTIRFAYGPDGNRITEEIYHDSTHLRKNTYYINDADGNNIAIYDWINKDTFKLDELILYGAARLGSISTDLLICDTVNNDSITNVSRITSGGSALSGVVYHTYGIKYYELTNHLGNVLVTITDRHIPVYNIALDHYLADVSSAQDYYPFGMEMPGRIFEGKYRYGFNGMEKDNEVAGKGNSYTTHFRHYDPRLGRWKSVDPEMKGNEGQSTYCGLDNNPISIVDPKGNNGWDYVAGIINGITTDEIPGLPGASQFWRNLYTPSNPEHYNNALEGTDNVMSFLGGVAQGGGAATAVFGAGAAATGGGLTLTGVGAPVGAPVLVGGEVLVGAGATVGGLGTLIKGNTENNRKDGYNYGKKPAQSQTNNGQTQTNTAKQADKINGNSTKSQKESGSYTNTHQSEKTYSGKGTEKRMEQSAKDVAKKYNDPVAKKDWKPAENAKGGYIDEHYRIENNGGAGNTSRNYNKINSPGKKLIEKK